MVDVNKAIIARINRGGQEFQILVDCDLALEYKKGKSISLSDVVAVDEIFKDVRKGNKASEHELEKLFETTDFLEIAGIIIKQGEIQITAKHLTKEREEKRKRVIDLIHRYAIDSKTGLPHPPQRIENAMREARVNIDDNKSAEEQIEKILEKLRPIIPIKFEVHTIQVDIPTKQASQGINILKKYKVLKTNWLSDGSLSANVEVPAGIEDEFMDTLNKLTHGNANIKILEKK